MVKPGTPKIILVTFIISCISFQSFFLVIPIVEAQIINSSKDISVQSSKDESQTTNYIPMAPTLAIDSSENLYLTYRENNGNYSKIALLKTNTDGDWNLTKTYLYQPDEENAISSYPVMGFYNDRFYLGLTFINETGSTLELLEINPIDFESKKVLSLSSADLFYKYPKIGFFNESIWFSWLSNLDGFYNVYCVKYNLTSESYSEIIQLSNSTYGSCQNSDLFLDNQGICHFVWSQGYDFENYIFYKSINQSEICQMSCTVVTNSTYSLDSEIYVEINGQINIFWSNYTEIAPIMLGTRNIHYRTFTLQNNWSQYERVAPYRTIENTDLMTDGENPEVVFDNIATLWMAYELTEIIPGFTGIAIRGRENGVWVAGEHVSITITPAYDPSLVSDSSGTVHCVWVDFRVAYFEIYYRARYSIGQWSFEQQLTNYSLAAYAENLPAIFGIVFGGIALFGILIPSTYFVLKRWRYKKIITERRKKITND